MGKTSRNKGKAGERAVASFLREYGYDTKRGAQYHGGPDSPDVVGLPGIHIEVKRTEAFRLWDALAQAKGDCGENIPVVWHRKNSCPWVVIMDARDWMKLYQAWEMEE